VSDFDLTGVVLEGRYQVAERIAEGAMGSVWRGERVKLGRQVAIKIMHEQLPDELASRERFEREAKLMARLDHPNCVSVIDFGIHEGMPFLVMELVRGTSLDQLMQRDGKFQAARAAELLRQVLSGLAHAHELGIVHRDIKPSNLMVGEKTGIGLQLRILDFGLARLTDTNMKLTMGIVVGTPNYMAPEQCRGGPLDGRCDLYACGVILFELLAGRKPFVAEDPYQIVRMHLHEPPPRLVDVAGGDVGLLDDVVARALAKNPQDRFASAQAMSAALEAAVAPRQGFGHAVPQVSRFTSSAPQIATESGWAVPTETTEPSAMFPPVSQPSPGREALPAASNSPPGAPEATSAPRRPLISRFRLPFSPTRRKVVLAGGGVAALVVSIVLVARCRGSAPPASAVASGDAGIEATAPTDAIVHDILDRIVAGDKDTALELALRARRQYPDNGELASLAGRIYFAKLYWTDGIRQFRDAIRLSPAYRTDPELIKTVLRGFITTPDVDDRIEEFLRVDIGPEARSYLEETARDHPNAIIRARAAWELKRFR
jgi:serine/threonine-protein kinase